MFSCSPAKRGSFNQCFQRKTNGIFFEKQHGHGLRDKKNGAGKNPAPYMKAGSVIKETLIYSNQYESILLILLVLRCFLAPPAKRGSFNQCFPKGV